VDYESQYPCCLVGELQSTLTGAGEEEAMEAVLHDHSIPALEGACINVSIGSANRKILHRALTAGER
jgi:hypothetical protein